MDVVQELMSEIRNLQCLAWLARRARLDRSESIRVPELVATLRVTDGEWEGIVRTLASDGHVEVLPADPAAAPAVRLTDVGRAFLARWEESLQLPHPLSGHGRG